MRYGKERDETGADFHNPRVRIERRVKDEVAGLVEPEPKRSAGEKRRHVACLCGCGPGSTAQHERRDEDPACRGTQVAPSPIEAQHLL
jgi:hypothetical protein